MPRRPSDKVLEQWHADFETARHRIEKHARVYFRDYIKDPDKLEEAIQDTMANAWKAYYKARLEGNDPHQFISKIAEYAAKHTRAGRHIMGMEKAKDVHSKRAQARHGFTVGKLPECDTVVEGNPALEGLHDNTQTPPDEQAAFRIDYPAWLDRFPDRDRRITIDMSHGERTIDLADKYKLSQGRLAQMRRERKEDWDEFHSEPEPAGRSR